MRCCTVFDKIEAPSCKVKWVCDEFKSITKGEVFWVMRDKDTYCFNFEFDTGFKCSVSAKLEDVIRHRKEIVFDYVQRRVRDYINNEFFRCRAII